MKKQLIFIAFFASFTISGYAQFICTFAGGGYGDMERARIAAVGVLNVCVDATGNIYCADYYNHRIFKIDHFGFIKRIAGYFPYGCYSGDGGPATLAGLNCPKDVALDAVGNIYFTDNGCRIRKINTSGIISTIAGNGLLGYNGDGIPATDAKLNNPYCIKFDSIGNIYFTDCANFRVRKINTSGIISTVAGTGTSGYSGDNGPATSAEFNYIYGLALDASSNIYVADFYNNRVRKISATGIITTFAGGGSVIDDGGQATSAYLTPMGLSTDNIGNVYIATLGQARIRKVSPYGIITTIAGNGTIGFTPDGGLATAALLNGASGVTVDGIGNVFISDYFFDSAGHYNNRIKKVDTFRVMSTVAGNGYLNYGGDNCGPLSGQIIPNVITSNHMGRVYIAEDSPRIRKVDAMITTFAGTGSSGNTGDGGQATVAKFNSITSMATDDFGNLFIADPSNHRIRKIAASGIITNYAGNGTFGISGDGSAATLAQFSSNNFITTDRVGNLFITDGSYSPLIIRKVDTSGIVSTFAGTLVGGSFADSIPATNASLGTITCLATDWVGNIFYFDAVNYRIRKIDTSGIINTIAGNGTLGLSGDGGHAIVAQLDTVNGMAIDYVGNIFLTDRTENKIRMIDTSGIIHTICGQNYWSYCGDGGLAIDAFLNNPVSLAFDDLGNLLIADKGNKCIRQIWYAVGIKTLAGETMYINVYPNPTIDIFIIDLPSSPIAPQIAVMNMDGNIVLERKLTQNVRQSAAFSLKNQPPGIYIITAICGDKIYKKRLEKK